ncbi:MAG: LLM class flavin-dependent oxidoreductase [Acidimicrobiaceae bacterium]|nr:LLM class flavin-dependent oxidoreductase [Acidimicrobiaceae bacterium]MXZ98088.1 LLM class flavin-dependent oxidoreductase [Acidimicrobiaceae bacterium]MYE76666.1 LLM class flavin-dependent oxidoreductase [Acidimicrobiaceae bacterium]MYE97051.1 LLM class flavin-dependent oxidoreductase [Acidimicrobiaceae bacterium]MYH43507.1 LLM class flavin-dependent oxidoreductase [Acidimicrobiaceae bacterium]
MTQRMALYFQDKHDIAYEIEMARYAEERGFSEIWQADTRLARDCVVMMSALLASTKRLRIASGVLPIYTRNPAVIAATWSTMHELAGPAPDGGSRVMLGLGAWWEPIAGRVGAGRRKPLTAMRENVEAIRALFTMEEVSYDGEFVQLDRVRLDVAYGDASPRDIPIYIGATGPRMLELTGEIADGAMLNYVVPTDYIRDAVARVGVGAARSGRTIDDIDRPELLICCLSDDDPAEALTVGKTLVAYYLGTEPHIMAASGADPGLIERVSEVVGWPATEADYLKAAPLISDHLVRRVMAAGTAEECRDKVAEYIDAGVTCPVLYPLMDDMKPVIDAFAGWTP